MNYSVTDYQSMCFCPRVKESNEICANRGNIRFFVLKTSKNTLRLTLKVYNLNPSKIGTLTLWVDRFRLYACINNG